MKRKKRYYNNCELLPLWNFFKLNNGELQNLKYLLVLDRLEYDGTVVGREELTVLEEIWGKVLEEYNGLDRNYGSINFINDRSKIVYYYTIYLQEQAMFKSLLYKTNVEHIRKLRLKGYHISNKSNQEYWQSLWDGINQVAQHITYIEILKAQIKDVGIDAKKEINPFDAAMAWIASNDIDVREDITVTRFIKIKEIIMQRIKAKQRENSKSRLHG